MKLSNVYLELGWPNSIKVKNLRKFIIDEISLKGSVIRWSINEIKYSTDHCDQKIIKINAVLVN